MKISKKKMYLYSLILYYVCLPFNAMNIGKIGSLLKVLGILPILIGLSNLKVKLNKLLKWQFIFSLFASASIIWSISIENTFSRVITYIELLILLFSVGIFEFTKDEKELIKKSLVWSSRIMVVLVLKFGILMQGRLYLNGIIKEDPNYICAYFSFGCVYALQKLIDKDRIKDKFFGLIEMVLYIFVVFLTGSRGGLIAIFACIFAYVLALIGNTNIKKSCGIIFLFLLMTSFCTTFIDYLPPELSKRFSIADVENSGGSGRTELWENGLNLYNSSSFFRQLFGYGTATVRQCFKIFNYSRVNVMHNIFLETLVELGVIGLFIYSISILNFAINAFKLEDKFAFAVIMCMIVMSLSTSLYAFKPYFNIMLFIIIASYNEVPNKLIDGEKNEKYII